MELAILTTGQIKEIDAIFHNTPMDNFISVARIKKSNRSETIECHQCINLTYSLILPIGRCFFP